MTLSVYSYDTGKKKIYERPREIAYIISIRSCWRHTTYIESYTFLYTLIYNIILESIWFRWHTNAKTCLLIEKLLTEKVIKINIILRSITKNLKIKFFNFFDVLLSVTRPEKNLLIWVFIVVGTLKKSIFDFLNNFLGIQI